MTLRARGGSGLFAWEPIAGELPPGVRLRDDGSIGGTPRIAGTFRFVARARDTEARSVGWPVVLRVAPRLVVRAKRLPPAKLDRSYSAEVTAAGGVAPRMWKLVSGRLPRGIRFAPTLGRFMGATSERGTFRLALEVRDRLNARSTRTFILVVRNPHA